MMLNFTSAVDEKGDTTKMTSFDAFIVVEE